MKSLLKNLNLPGLQTTEQQSPAKLKSKKLSKMKFHLLNKEKLKKIRQTKSKKMKQQNKTARKNGANVLKSKDLNVWSLITWKNMKKLLELNNWQWKNNYPAKVNRKLRLNLLERALRLKKKKKKNTGMNIRKLKWNKLADWPRNFFQKELEKKLKLSLPRLSLTSMSWIEKKRTMLLCLISLFLEENRL